MSSALKLRLCLCIRPRQQLCLFKSRYSSRNLSTETSSSHPSSLLPRALERTEQRNPETQTNLKIKYRKSAKPPLVISKPTGHAVDEEQLSYYWDTQPPTSSQLQHASEFFTKQPSDFIWSAEKFLTMDYGTSPEVCFLGRSNVGKSSLLNSVLGRKLAHTSGRPGRTRLMNAFSVGGNAQDGSKRLVIIDMPGYGKGGQAEWGTEILKYLQKRKQLRRAFVLIDSLHGIKTTDKQLIELLKEHDLPFQIVMTKIDRALFRQRKGRHPPTYDMLAVKREALMKDIMPKTPDDGGTVGEIIACSSEKLPGTGRVGIEALRFAVLRAAGLELQDKVSGKQVEVVSHEELEEMSRSRLSVGDKRDMVAWDSLR